MRGMAALNRLIDDHIVRALARTPKHLHPTIASFGTLVRVKSSPPSPAKRRPLPGAAKAPGAS